MAYDNLDEIIEEILDSLDFVNLLCYKCHKINFKHGGLYMDISDWIKKATINPKMIMIMINVFHMQ